MKDGDKIIIKSKDRHPEHYGEEGWICCPFNGGWMVIADSHCGANYDVLILTEEEMSPGLLDLLADLPD